MIVQPLLALNSDRLFMAAVGVFVLAMGLHSVDYAVARAGAGRATVPALSAAGVALQDDPPRPARTGRYGRMAVSLTVLGAVLLAGSVATRGLATGRWPLGNMYEFASAICLVAVVAWLVVLRRASVTRPAGLGSAAGGSARASVGVGYPDGSRTAVPRDLSPVGLFVLLPVVVLLFLAGTVLYAQAAPVQPALQSYWLAVHVTAISISCGMLLVAGVASLLYLVRRAGWGERLPDADVLDRLAYRITIVAFPIYTFAVIAGAIWAEAAWGRFWGWDPKETIAFVAWVVYAAYLHARATAGWRTGRAAWINVAGFLTVAFNLFFINMVVAGLHSYAGL